MKKVSKIIIFVVLLVFVLILSVACGKQVTVYETEDGNWKCEIKEEEKDGVNVCTAILDEYIGSSNDVVIPKEVIIQGKTFTVTSLAEGLFVKIEGGVYVSNENIVTVTFAEDCQVTEIPFRTFYLCDKLTNITFSENITAIKDFAFFGCSSLDNVHLTSNISKLGAYTFRECSSLKDLYIDYSLASEISELNIPTIGDKCFYGFNEKEKEYYVYSELKIHVSDISLYDSQRIEEHRVSTKSKDYKYWTDYEDNFVLDSIK